MTVLARICMVVGVGCLIGALLVGAPTPPGANATTLSTTSPNTLLAEGGSLAEPYVSTLMHDDTADQGTVDLSYFQDSVDIGREDFVDGDTDVAVSEYPLTSAEADTAAANGRGFAYVPFAASADAIGYDIQCTTATVIADLDYCSPLQLTAVQLAKIFTDDGITTWNSSELNTISNGEGIEPTQPSNQIVTKYIIDPSAANQTFFDYLYNTPAAKSVWCAWIAELHATCTSPGDIWPNNEGITGGDLNLADALVPIDETTNEPLPDPTSWGQGIVATVPSAWLGTPWDIPTIAVQNAAGSFVKPTNASISAALNDATFNSSTNLVTFNSSVSDTAAYPMPIMSYLIVPTNGLSATKATALAQFIRYVLGSTGQGEIEALGGTSPTAAMIAAGKAVADTVAAEGTTPTTSTTAAGGTTTTSESTDCTACDGGGGGSDLAFTGSNPIPIAAVGAVMIAAGAILRRRSRKKVPL